MQEGPGPPECMVAQEEVPRELAKETQIQPEEELKEINLGAKLRSQKPIRGRMRGHLRPKRPPEEKEIEREPSTSGSQECVILREPGGRLIYHL